MKLSILQKMLGFIVVPVIIGLGAVTYSNYSLGRRAMEAQIAEELEQVVRAQRIELTNTVNVMAGTIRKFAQESDVVNFLAAAKNSNSSMDLSEAQGLVLMGVEQMCSSFDYLRDVGVMDASGRVLAHSDPNFIGSNLSDRVYFKAAMEGREEAMTIVSKANGQLSSVLGVAVKRGNEILGVVYGTLALEKIASSSTDNVSIANTGICFVYDKNSILLMHPNKDYVGDDDSQLDWVQHMQEAKSGHFLYEWDGQLKLAYFDYVPGVEWLVVVSVEDRDMFAPVNNMFYMSLLIGVIAMLVICTIIILVARNISSPLKFMDSLVAKIAHGELTLSESEEHTLSKESSRSDEIGGVARGTRGMLEGLRRLFADSEQKTAEAETAAQEARKAAEEAELARTQAESARRDGMLAAAGHLEVVVEVISSASAELEAQIKESEDGAEHQAARMAETATAMEEMNSTVLEVAKNAGAAAEVSASTREKAEAGAAVVEKAVSGILKVQEQSLALKQDMVTLADNARSIGEIMSVISDIADQTNLLALNAAIEAARAGEAGRGFAVVADEVRKLAEKTMSATSHVGGAIKSIQDSAAKSMEQVDSAVASIEEATAMANQSGAALSEIVSMVDMTADQVRAIAAASEQQSASSEEINESITQVNSIAAETARAMQESSKAVSDLAEQAQRLNGLIEEMKNS